MVSKKIPINLKPVTGHPKNTAFFRLHAQLTNYATLKF